MNDRVARVAMRFRLHNANSGQVTKNKTAIAALSLQVDALSPSEGGIEITSGVNDTFIFKHTVVTAIGASNPTKTYTLVLAGQSYTLDELVTALNAALVAHGNVANSITTTIVLVGGKIAVQCTAVTTIVYGIEIINSSGREALGFEVGQSIPRYLGRSGRVCRVDPRRDKRSAYRHCFGH